MKIDPKISFGHADVGELKLHYAKAGEGERLVLLLHGFPEFWYSWRHQLVDLSDEYTVVAPDLRGYNLSDRPEGKSNYLIDHLVNDVAGLVRHFGAEKAAVIGHDWGASIAWAVASKRPDLLWKLGALQVPPIPIWKRNQTLNQLRASWYMFFFQLPGLPEFLFSRNDFAMMAEALPKSTARPGIFTPDEIAEYKIAWSRPGAPTALLNYYRANILSRMFGSNPVPKEKIEVPTLFIYGEKDTAVMPTTVEGVGDMVSGRYTELRIPDSGHWVQQEAREEVTAALKEFLTD